MVCKEGCEVGVKSAVNARVALSSRDAETEAVESGCHSTVGADDISGADILVDDGAAKLLEA